LFIEKPHVTISSWGYISAYLPNWKPFKNDFNCFVTDLSGRKKTTDKINLNFPPGWW